MVKKFSHRTANTGHAPSMPMAIGYCVKCRNKREIQGAEPTTLKNGRPAVRGTCPACSTRIFRIGRP